MPEETPDRMLKFMRHVGRHLGCLVISYEILHADLGKVGEEKVVSYSGFFIDVGGIWFFVTAGHVFDDAEEGVDTLRAVGKLRVLSARVVDCFGTGAANYLPTILSYDDLPRITLDERHMGLDFALIPLREFYRRGVEANGVVPFKPENWTGHLPGDLVGVGIAGFPEEEKIHAGGNDRVDGWIRPVFVWVAPCPPPEDKPETDYPLFTAIIPTAKPASPVGLSGGPVLQVLRQDDGSYGYTLLGVQSFWWKKSRVVFACPMVSFFQHIRHVVKTHPSLLSL